MASLFECVNGFKRVVRGTAIGEAVTVTDETTGTTSKSHRVIVDLGFKPRKVEFSGNADFNVGNTQHFYVIGGFRDIDEDSYKSYAILSRGDSSNSAFSRYKNQCKIEITDTGFTITLPKLGSSYDVFAKNWAVDYMATE